MPDVSRTGAWMLLFGVIALPGCAHFYVDDDGTRNAIGLMHVKLPPVDPSEKGAETLRVVSIGLTLTRTDVGSAVSLGYGDVTAGWVRNDSCVRIAPSLLQGVIDGSPP